MSYFLFLSLLCGVFAVKEVLGGSWLIGCYYVNQTLDQDSLLDGVSVRLKTGSVVECGETCLQAGYDYIGLHSPQRCSCYNVTTMQMLQHQGLKKIPPEHCNVSCNINTDVALPCGAGGLRHLNPDLVISPVSLYLSAGPYLTHLSLHLDADWVVVDTRFAVEAVANLAGYLNITNDWANTSKSGLELTVTWTVGENIRTETIEAWRRNVISRVQYTFYQAGNYTVQVKVSNVISSLTTSIQVTVINPEPKDLQLALLTDEDYRPSCTPKECDIRPGTVTVAVFANYTSTIEASVSIGANLTFVLEFGDDGVTYTYNPSEESPQCEERNCTAVVQTHVFRETGVYNVTVTVSNIYDSVQGVMTVVVVHHKLSNLSLSLLESDAPRLVTPLEPVTFLLKVETASRRDTFMEFYIGNNNTRLFTVTEFNTSALTLSEPDRAAIAASYGVGCTLEVELVHVFKSEGVYRPVLTAHNNVSTISTESQDEIVVMSKIIGPKLHASSIASMNTPSTYHIDFMVKSRNMSISWKVMTRNLTLIYTAVDATQTWSYNFTAQGHYNVSVTASNLQGNVSASAAVYVQVPIRDLILRNPPKFHAMMGHTLSLNARIDAGSDVTFLWSFEDASSTSDIVSKSMSSQANHTFYTPGKYNISIIAVNNVSREVVYLPELFIVQQRVTFVVLQSTDPTVLGNGTIFLSMNDRGTDVKFDFDFGEGRTAGRGEYKKNKKKYFVTHFFRTAGIHVVKVFAYNLVSEVTAEIDVIVEEPVPEFTIEVVGPLIANRSAVFAAMRGGDVIRRPDLIYTWYVGNYENQTVKTRSPLLSWTFHEPGLYNVSLEAGNRLEPLIGVGRADREFSVLEDEEQLTLHHCGVVKINTTCEFTVQGNLTDVGDVTVQYRNEISGPEEKTVNPRGWRFVLKQSGLHRVFVRGQRDGPYGNTQQFELSSFFIVEEPISGLQLKGPQVVALQSLPRRYVWEALLDQGSHIIYVWALGNNRSLPTTYREYAQFFIERGTYVLFLELFNDVSRVMANLTIVAQHPIVDLETTVAAVVLNVTTNVSLVIEGGRQFWININFGDGQEAVISSEDKNLQIQTTPGDWLAVPEHRVFVPHLYTAMGEYTITVNVSNRLSWKTVSKVARVEEPITGIVITSDSRSIIPVGESVEVRVTVATGKDLTFVWKFTDGKASTIESDTNSSLATHTFSRMGTFMVSVAVSNPYVKAPLVVRLPYEVQVVQRIMDVTLEVVKAAELKNRQGNWSTDNVHFSGTCYECSHVRFHFDFGDGTSQSVAGDEELLRSLMSGEVSHRYKAVGVYWVSVTATNPLNNMTDKPRQLWVQVGPKDLRLDQKGGYKTRFGNDTDFRANISQGTNVTFDWKFGDDQENLNGGPVVTHRYLDRGNFTMSVTAKNRVGSLEIEAKVNVQYFIQGVDLKVNTTIVASGEHVEFSAIPYPQEFAGDHNFVGWYNWKIDPRYGAPHQSRNNRITYKYNYAGKNKTRVTVTVEAVNFISNATSKPIDLYILSKVVGLQMKYSGVPLLNNTLTFRMTTYSGSELTFTWDFGDGTIEKSGYSHTVNHTFTRVGEFEVVGFVENDLSNATVRKTIFIMESLCLPPEISILPHLPGTPAKFEVERSKEVKIELEIKVNCSITHATAYTWTLLNETTGETVDVSHIPASVFTERMLYFPPLTLNYGGYVVHLEVKINGTIVYSKVDIQLVIIPAPLISVITGGILRRISIQENVVLDGGESRDPDFMNATDLRYNWTCYRLTSPGIGCFGKNLTYVLETNSSRLQFPGHYLTPNTTNEEFAFNLTVTKPGRVPGTSTQTLTLANMDSPKTLQIRIACPACMDGLVNNNQRIAMKVVCESCDFTEEIRYEWAVDEIRNDESSPASDDSGGQQCETLTSAAPPIGLNAGDPVPPKPQETGPVTTTTKTTKTTTTTTTVSPRTAKVTTIIPGLPIPNEDVPPGRNRNGRERRESDEPEDPIPMPQPGSQYGQDSTVMGEGQYNNINMMEGRSEESGSAGGRSGSGFRENPTPDRNTQNNQQEPKGNPLYDQELRQPIPREKLIVELPKGRYNINPKYLTTGYNKDVFVLKPGALRQGQKYIFSVKAYKKGESEPRGESWVNVKVNQSPGRGICTIPDNTTASYELEQVFQVFCREWQDDGQGPLSYEVSYKLNASQDEPFNNLIYRGLSTKVEFRLPAGQARPHHVFVRILISDNFGASTEACNITLTVLPREHSNDNGTLEQQLYNEVSRNDSTLGIFISQKDYSNTRVFATYLTLSLNRLGSQPSGSEVIRREVRHILLSLLNSFPIRDEYELLQTIQPVLQLTKVIEELDSRSVKKATQLLKQIAAQLQTIYKDKDSRQADVLRYIVEISSNIMAASSLTRTLSLDEFTTLPTRKVGGTEADTSVTSVTWVIDTVLQGQLESRYVGEEAIHWSSEYISVFANRYGTMKGPVIEMGEARCSLPKDMSVVLPTKTLNIDLKSAARVDLGGSANENCYEAHMITFDKNPFSLHEPDKKDFEVHSKVTSLKIIDCQGREVKVGNLSKNNLVRIEIPQKKTEREPLISHTLNKWQMNVHQFNITEQNFNRSLHIQIDLIPATVGRLFPIAVLISCGEPPRPKVYLSKTVFSADRNNLPLYLPAGTFNETGPCFLGLVDSNYNAGRPRPLDVRERVYTLKTWWGQCLFWDEKKNSWSGKGCYTTANSTLNSTICLCNHLTMFASRLDLVPNDLHFTNVEDFFELYKSAVMFTWITALFLMYLIAVIFCRRIDLHHARKGGVVYLQDNAITDHQKYEITLETGFRKGAGTTAKISVILHGEEGMSETRELISEEDQPLFERNSRDTFVMTLPDNIGRIWKVQLWHNNSGSSPSWYVSRVTIRDLSCGHTYYFICEKWLAVEEDEGKVEGEFMSLEGNLGFKKVFWAKGTQYATDFHLWASVVTCPSYSRFTRVQRLTCCLSLLMSYMCLNAMWYRERVEQYRGEFGLLDLSWRSVVVGCAICAIVLPLNLFLVFLFRRSKVKNRQQSKEDIYRAGKCEHLDESAEEAVQPVMTYSILDQSLLNWQSIQEWAQKQWVKRQQSEVSSSDSVKNSPQIEHTKKSDTLEQASSGFEDCASQDRVQPTVETKKSDTSERSSNKYSQYSGKTRRPRQCLLPSCCAYLAWTLAVIIIVVCAVVTMMYGYRFGKTKSTMWLQSFYFSFMICIFISHPFLVLILTVYTAIRYRNDPSIFDHHHHGHHGKHKSESLDTKERVYCEECDELERGVAARQRSRYLRFARPPQEKHLIEARKKIMKEKKAYAVLQDYWKLMVFLLILAIMAYGKDLSGPFYVNESLKNSLVRSGSPSFTSIRNIPTWWSWAQSGFLEGVFSHVAYDRDNLTSTQTANLYVIGHVHIRQLRVNSPVQCQSPTHSALLNTCHDSYATESRAEEPYGPNQTWRHSFYQQYYNLRGTHGTYDSSGYVVKLNKSRSEAYKQLEELQALDWLDVKTRAIVIEFTIFYAPISLFTSVTLLVETPSTGGAFPHPSIISTYLYRYISVWDNLVLAAELFFILLVLYSVNAVIVQMITLQNKYFSNPWNVLDVVFSLMSLAYIGCYIYRFVLVYDTKEYLLSSYYEKFVDISTLAHWDEILKAMVGFMLALVTCKFLYLLRYKRTFSNLGNFYKRAYREFFAFSAMFVVFLLAYTSLGYAAFGVFSPHFRDFWVSLETMAGILLGGHKFPEFEMYNVIGSKFFIVTYLILMAGLLTCYIVAVLSYQYKIFRQGEMIAMGCSDTLRFFWERFLTWAGIKRPPPDDEPDSDLPPEFTMAEIEYQVDELLFRMNAISGSSNLPEKPPCYFTDSDVPYGVGDDGISSGEGSEMRPFDESRFEQRIQKIEENLYSQEPYLAQLIKLDSIGADVLSHEREKQLRSHLELEIFRRLQMQREQRLRSSDRSSSSGGSLSLPVHSSSRHESPVGGASNRKGAGLFTRLKPVARSESSLLKLQDDGAHGNPEHPNLQTILAPNEDNITDLSKDTGDDSAFPEHLIREALSRDFGVQLDIPKARHKQVEKTKSGTCSTSCHSTTSDEWRRNQGEATTSSEDNTHVTGAGARAKVKHGGEPKVKPETATPSSAKVFSHSSLRDLPPIEITKTSIIGSPGVIKRKAPPGSFSLLNPQTAKPGPSGIVLESSSGSEQDAYRGRRPASKARTLRKTKSRGKGKGGKRLPTLDSLEDDLSFENDGYNTDTMYGTPSSTSESSKDKSSSSSENKQAWL